MDISSWKWNPRYDLDLAQRCLFILFFTWATNWVLQSTFLNYIFGDYLVHLAATIALLLAIAKSSLQLSPKRKSVLVTGSWIIVRYTHYIYGTIVNIIFENKIK